MRTLGFLLPAALLAGCGGTAEEAAPDSATRTAAPSSSPSPSPDGPGKGGVPPRDERPTRTGEVPLKSAPCAEGAPAWSFDGTVTDIGRGEVTFEVHESFLGDLPATYVVAMGAPVPPGRSDAPPSYAVGTRMLVEGSDGEAGCGGVSYYDEETAQDRRS